MIDITQEEIMKNWGCEDSEHPLVSIKCMAYNHERYISKAIDGFLLQKTKFPYEILIHDDCSTDNTAKVIADYAKKFPKIIKPIFESENQYSKPIPYAHHKKIDAAIRGKYIALCEGDDYWIDENKLQKQVDFLENNPDYGLVYGKVKEFIQEDNFYRNIIGENIKNVKELIQKGNLIPTATVLFRKDLIESYLKEIHPENKNWLMGDYPMNLWFAQNSKIHFIDSIMGIYRVLKSSASHSSDLQKLERFSQSTNEILSFFQNKYGYDFKIPDHVLMTRFIYALNTNNREEILKNCNYKKMLHIPFNVKIKVFLFRSNFLFNLYKKLKK